MIDHAWRSPEYIAAVAEKHPFRGLGRPEDVAKVVLFLVSEDNTWMTGTAVTVDGGYTLQ